MNAGRNGGCPVLLVGITPKCIEDWAPEEAEVVEASSSEPALQPDSGTVEGEI
jgi:hypothetical protein